MKTKIIKVGFSDIKEAEAKLNEELKKVENFVGYQVVNNGQNSAVIVFTDDNLDNDPIIPQVKIVEFGLNGTEETENALNEALKDIDPVRFDIATPIDGDRLIILYDGTPEDEEPADEEPKDDDDNH